MSEFTTDEWAERLSAATTGRVVAGLSGNVAIEVKGNSPLAFRIEDGSFAGLIAVDGEAEVRLPLTPKQFSGIRGGDSVASQAYMRGDVKPIGSTGALLALLDFFDHGFFAE